MQGFGFRLFTSFLMVAERRSFRLAAESVGRSPSAVTMQIKQLEQQIGLVLFHRTGRGVELTEDGQRLLLSVRKALAELESGISLTKELAIARGSRFSIACTPSIASNKMPRLLDQFQRECPGIIIDVHERSSQDVCAAVRKSEVAIGIAPVSQETDDFSYRALVSDRIMALLPHSSDLASKEKLSIHDLQTCNDVIVKRDGIILSVVNDLARKAGFSLNMRHNLARTEAMLAMVQRGLGIALVAEHSIPAYGMALVRAVCLDGVQGHSNISLMWLKDTALSPASARFVDFMCHSFRPKGTKGPNQEPAVDSELRPDIVKLGKMQQQKGRPNKGAVPKPARRRHSTP